MLLKLYRKENNKTLYWEAWPDGQEIVIHFGELGDTGETTAIVLPEFEPPETAIEKHADEARQAGFQDLSDEDIFELIVQYNLSSSNGITAEKAFQLEEILNDFLGWTGLGNCDGSDCSSSSLNIYCYVVEPHIAGRRIVDELRSGEMLDGALIAFQDRDENFVVLWPENYSGVFEY